MVFLVVFFWGEGGGYGAHHQIKPRKSWITVTWTPAAVDGSVGNMGILSRSCPLSRRPRKASNRNSNRGTVLASIKGLPPKNLE